MIAARDHDAVVAPPDGAAERVLRVGRDFDAVVSALPIDSLRALLRTTPDFDADKVFARADGARWEFRRNSAHHMRYVLAEPGHWKHRLDARVGGYDNLFFAGDWVKSSQPTPSTEAAVRAGVTAATAALAAV